MKGKILLLCAALFVSTLLLESCASRKGCGCGNNLNYYKPRKFKK